MQQQSDYIQNLTYHPFVINSSDFLEHMQYQRCCGEISPVYLSGFFFRKVALVLFGVSVLEIFLKFSLEVTEGQNVG